MAPSEARQEPDGEGEQRRTVAGERLLTMTSARSGHRSLSSIPWNRDRITSPADAADGADGRLQRAGAGGELARPHGAGLQIKGGSYSARQAHQGELVELTNALTDPHRQSREVSEISHVAQPCLATRIARMSPGSCC